jgi:hypothetical protein
MTRLIIDYAIEKDDNTEALTEKVKAALGDGWQPFGNAYHVSNRGHCQPMVKYGAWDDAPPLSKKPPSKTSFGPKVGK